MDGRGPPVPGFFACGGDIAGGPAEESSTWWAIAEVGTDPRSGRSPIAIRRTRIMGSAVAVAIALHLAEADQAGLTASLSRQARLQDGRVISSRGSQRYSFPKKWR